MTYDEQCCCSCRCNLSVAPHDDLKESNRFVSMVEEFIKTGARLIIEPFKQDGGSSGIEMVD